MCRVSGATSLSVYVLAELLLSLTFSISVFVHDWDGHLPVLSVWSEVVLV